MFKNLLDKGKCRLGFHAGEWRYISDDTCQQVQICERCNTESHRTAHNWPEWQYRADGDCTLVRICERCREEESKVDHTWADWQYIHRYDCIQQRTCSRCGAIHGQTQKTHQWANWEFSDHFSGPVRVCSRCGELAKPGSSGRSPTDEELKLIFDNLHTTRSQDTLRRVLDANQQALFSRNATEFLGRIRQEATTMLETQRLDTLEQFILLCQDVGIDAAVAQFAASTPSYPAQSTDPSPEYKAAAIPTVSDLSKPNIDQQLVGKWSNSYFEGGSSAILYTYYIDLKADGTFTQSENTVYAGSSYGSTGIRETGRGQWELKQGLLVLSYADGNQVACRYQLQGNKLHCQFMNGNYQEWERA